MAIRFESNWASGAFPSWLNTGTEGGGVTPKIISGTVFGRTGNFMQFEVAAGQKRSEIHVDQAHQYVRGEMQVEVGGQPKTLRLRFLNAWTKTPQGWKFVAWQSTPLPA